MQVKKVSTFLIIFLALIISVSALDIPAKEDATYSDGQIDSSNTREINNNQALVGDIDTGIRYRFFIDFDTSSIPDSATITDVTLSLTTQTTSSGSINISYLSQTAKSTVSDSDLFIACGGQGDSDILVNGDSSFNGQGDGFTGSVDLGETANSEVQSKLGSDFFSICIKESGESALGTADSALSFYESSGSTESYRPKLVVTYTDSSDPLNTSEPHINLDSQETNISISYMESVTVEAWGINGTANLFSNISGSVELIEMNTSYLLGVGTYNFTVQINGTQYFQGSNETWQVNVTKAEAPLNLSVNGTLLTANQNYSVWENQVILLSTNNDTGFGILAVNATDNSSGSRTIIIASNESTSQNYSSSLIPGGSNFGTVNIILNSTSTYNFSQTNTSYFLTINRSVPTWTSFSPSFTVGSTTALDLTDYISHPTDSEFTYTHTNGTNINATIVGDTVTFRGAEAGSETLQFNVTDMSGDNATINIEVTISNPSSGGGGSSSSRSYTIIDEDPVDQPVFEPQITPEEFFDEPAEEEQLVEEPEKEPDQLKDDLIEVSCTENCDAFYDNLVEQMKKVQDKVELQKETYYNEETDKTETKIILKVKEDLEDFEYVQSVPKCMAIAAHLIEFKEPPTQILKDDPLIAWQFAEIKAGTELDLSFDVLGQVPEDCYELVQELFYERPSPPNYRNIIISSIIILLIIGGVIYALWPTEKRKQKRAERKSKKTVKKSKKKTKKSSK